MGTAETVAACKTLASNPICIIGFIVICVLLAAWFMRGKKSTVTKPKKSEPTPDNTEEIIDDLIEQINTLNA